MARRKKSSGCLATLFFLPISLAFVLTWYIFKIALYVMFYLAIFAFYLIWYIVAGLLGLIFHKSQFHAKCNSGEEYEQICCQKLKQHGFAHIQTTPRTGDHGIDILAKRAGKKYAIQCKYYSSSVGNHAVQEAFSGCSYYGYDIPVVLTNNVFTQNAIDEARKLGVQLWSQNRIPFSDKSFFSNLFKKQPASQQEPTNAMHFETIPKNPKSSNNVYSQSKTDIQKSDNVAYSSVMPDIPNLSDTFYFNPSHKIGEYDVYFEEVGRCFITKGKASIGMIQRMYKLGFNRAAQIMDQLCKAGVVGPEEGTKPRKVLMSMDEFDAYLKQPFNSIIDSIDTKFENDSLDDKSMTIEEYANLVGKIVEKPVDFSQDGILLDKMQNMVITQVSDQIKNDLLDDLICYNTHKTLHIILFDKNKFNFFAYKDIPNLIVPIISESNKLRNIFKWACDEMDKRTSLFLEHKVKNIFDYNKKASSEDFSTLPTIIIIIDELYGLYDIFTKELDTLLLDSGRRGIFIIGFSKLELKQLDLGSTEFLWKKYINNQISGMFIPFHVSDQGIHNSI